MRKVAVWGFVLVAIALVFPGTEAQRSAPINTAPTTRPAQVEVTNFPVVQAVSGSINVGNLPAIQPVSGSVQVSNLPFDADGNLRVVSNSDHPAYKIVRLFDVTTFSPSPSFVSLDPVDVAGWKSATVFINHPGGPPEIGNNYFQVEQGIGDHFVRVSDVTLNDERDMTNMGILLPQLRLSLLATTDQTIEGWLYLFN